MPVVMPVVIRTPRSADLLPLTELYNYYIVNTPITFDLQPYTVEQRRERWFNHYHPTGRYRLFVAEQAGQAVGYVTSSPFRVQAAYETSIETSIYVHPDQLGLGIGTQLYQTLFAALAQEDVHRVYAGITLPNSASVALHRKLGFDSVGIYHEVGRKWGRYWDVEWFEKSLQMA